MSTTQGEAPVFVGRLLVILFHLRHGATLNVLGTWFRVDRYTIT
ncbi:transposase family protein [Streptomyces sp. NBC_00233]|nr:transposase family protein [Streptomyces sp. NBC_00233]MCX5233333.1 transposase family protein [Streptomyces sp. NBC_00233]